MKVKALFVLLLGIALMSGGVARQTVFNVSGRVLDESGKGIAGVVVNNGMRFTLTGEDGRWSLLTDTLTCKYISISTPADFRLPSTGGVAAGFYVPVGKAVADGGHTFVLERRSKPSESFYYIAISDPQVCDSGDMRRWQTETMADIRHTVDSLKRKREVVGVALGDIVFDNMPLFKDYVASIRNTGMTMFQCIGNHDFDERWQDLHNMQLGTPVYGEMEYNRHFGPTDYSFNIGKAHVVTMKNINYVGGRYYIEGMTGAQLEWLKNDLSYVPKGTLVLLNMHAPGWNTVNNTDNMRNAGKLAEVLEGYRVHVFCGHTHFYQNVEVNENLYQHNIGAACGAWWAGNVNRCGAPNGYLVVDVNGDELRWHYKPTGLPVSRQFALYGRGEYPQMEDYVVANVWDYDSRCRVEWFLDGRPMGEMERFTGVDAAYASQEGSNPAAGDTPHLFRCRPDGRSGKVKVVFTNRFGEQFSAETE